MSASNQQGEGQEEEEKKKQSGTYEAGCHCGYIKLTMTLSPPLPEYTVVRCNCSVCSHLGYSLVYPKAKDVVWHNNGRKRCASYRFNSKQVDQMFCPKCGATLGIDFEGTREEPTYGITVRALYGINLDDLTYRDFDGVQKVEPAQDLAGQIWDEEKQELR